MIAVHAGDMLPGMHANAAMHFADVVEVIGDRDFAERVLSSLDAAAGAGFCAFHRLSGYELVEVAAAGTLPNQDQAAWRKHLMHHVKRHMMSAGAAVRTERIPIASGERGQGAAAEGGETILISMRRDRETICLVVVPTPGRAPVAEDTIDWLRGAAWLLLAAASKHAALTLEKPDLAPALTSLEEIEACLTCAADLSRRESEVCARILYGLSSYGIALDLGIGKESVMTYRKRAYNRLGIASQRELLIWYLAAWSKQGNAPLPAEADAPAA